MAATVIETSIPADLCRSARSASDLRGRGRMDRYNGSHKMDLTAYQAMSGIDQSIKQVGRNLGRLIIMMARMTGFQVIGPLHLRHEKTGKEILVRERKGE